MDVIEKNILRNISFNTTNRIMIVVCVAVMCSLFSLSCIDRDTIAGTGKEIPDRLVNIGGTLQSGAVTAKLPEPLRVRVVASNGRPVKGVVVEFYVEDQNASLSDSSKITDGDGYAQTYVTLGTKVDSIYVYASVLGLKGSPTKFSLFAVVSSTTNPNPVNPSMRISEGDNQTGPVGKKLQDALKVKIADEFENPVPNMTVFFSTENGSITPDSALTNDKGIASAFWTLDTTIGTQNAMAECHDIPTGGIVNFRSTATPVLVVKYLTRLCSDTFVALQGTTINKILHVNVLDQYRNPIYSPPPNGFYVDFFVTEGHGSVTQSITDENGDAFAGVTLAADDSVLKITADVGNNVPALNFTFFAYKYFQIDSLRSSGGTVKLFWQKNPNLHFNNYVLQRCNNFNFDNTSIDVETISDENITSTEDNTAVVGSSPFYRLKVNYSNGFYFYTNTRNITVNP